MSKGIGPIEGGPAPRPAADPSPGAPPPPAPAASARPPPPPRRSWPLSAPPPGSGGRLESDDGDGLRPRIDRQQQQNVGEPGRSRREER
eukprot:5025619-Pyramimonas_sp.AAC.1